jgi:hypothetical protein
MNKRLNIAAMPDEQRHLLWRMFFGAQDRLGLTDEETAPMLEQSPTGVKRWPDFPQLSAARMHALSHISETQLFLNILLPNGNPAGWMRAPNTAFNSQSALQHMQRGLRGVSEVWDYLGRANGWGDGLSDHERGHFKIEQARHGAVVILARQGRSTPSQK